MKIGFVGSMNSMPMAYALRFVRDGFDVKYMVDGVCGDYLNRPEYQYAQNVAYPYPNWIIERSTGYSLIGHAFASRTYSEAIRQMQDRDVIFLNDYGLSLADRMPKSAKLIALSSGSDIDVYCNYRAAWFNAFEIRRKWLWPVAYALNLLRAFGQRRGLSRCSAISYFPPGLNKVGDDIILRELQRRLETVFIPRYDVDFDSTGIRFVEPLRRPIERILVPVRFNMNPGGGNWFEYKGNDIIIEGLGKYVKRNPGVEILFFKKGPERDLEIAADLCRVHGISERVTWLDPMPLQELLELYYSSDVCIDQVGSHWMGAIGAYSLFCGRPLIANWRPEVFGDLWGGDVPILQATSADEVYQHLVYCEDYSNRQALASKGNAFAQNNLSAEVAYKKFRSLLAQ